MLRKFLKVSLISLASLALMLILAWFIDNKVEIATVGLQTLTDVVSVSSSLILLVLGLLLFQKFGGNQSIVDKQTDVVISLMKDLSRLGFSMRPAGADSHAAWELVNIDIFNYEKQIAFGKKQLFKDVEMSQTKQYLDDSYTNISKILYEYCGNTYLPLGLAKEGRTIIDKVLFSVTPDDESVPKNYLLISSYPIYIGKKSDRLISAYGADFSDVKVEEVVADLRKLYDHAHAWLKKNNEEVYNTLNVKNPYKYL